MKDLPSNVDMEKELLSMMMFKSGVSVPKIVDIVSADDFYRPEHRLIFRALTAVYKEQQQTNLLSLIEKLTQMGKFDHIGTQYLFALSDIAHTDAYAANFAKTIKEKAQLREFIKWGSAVLDKAYKEMATPEDLRAALENFLLTSAPKDSSDFKAAPDVGSTVFQRTLERSKTKGLTGVTTGLTDLNKVTNGFQKAELILLAARPSMGKTALALNIAQNAARSNHPVAVFSLEMSCEQLGARLLSTLSGVDCTKINSGNVDLNDVQALVNTLEYLDRLPLYIDDTSDLTVAQMRNKAKRLKQDKGLDFIVVDYLQLMRGTAENRVQEVSEVSRGLKALAKEFNVPVLALSQLSRNVEMRAEKKPQLSDLRDSGSLEQDADLVLFLYRDEYYNRDGNENQNVAELIVAKNRNGSTGAVQLFFDKATTKFGNLTRYVDR